MKVKKETVTGDTSTKNLKEAKKEKKLAVSSHHKHKDEEAQWRPGRIKGKKERLGGSPGFGSLSQAKGPEV